MKKDGQQQPTSDQQITNEQISHLILAKLYVIIAESESNPPALMAEAFKALEKIQSDPILFVKVIFYARIPDLANLEATLRTLLQPTFTSQWPKEFDTVGTPVAQHLETPPDTDIYARRIQTYWRKSHQARVRYRQPTIFGVASKNGLDNRFQPEQLPNEFRYLAQLRIPALFERLNHSSIHLAQILHDGAIYSADKCGSKGASNQFDKSVADNRLVFTNTNNEIEGHSITLSLKALCNLNYSNSFMFKFNDWSLPTKKIIPLLPGLSLEAIYKFPSALYKLIHNNACVAEIPIQGEDLIYYGLAGLNSYITFFIFKLFAKIADTCDAKRSFFSHIRSLEQSKVIGYLQGIAKELLGVAELNSVNTLRLSFNSLEQVNYGNVYDFNALRNAIKRDDLSLLKSVANCPLFKHSYFLAKGMLDHAEAHSALQAVAFIKKEFAEVLSYPFAVKAKLIERAQYVYNRHLCKPYAESPERVVIADHTIFRPLHGLALHLRSAYYTSYVINYYKLHAKDADFRQFCSQITPEKLLEIQTALLFSSTGRESEISHGDNPVRYDQYRVASAEHFAAFAKDHGYSLHCLEKYRELVRYMGNPSYPDRNTFGRENLYIFHIMNLAHKLDLMKVYNKDKFLESIQTTQTVTTSSPQQVEDLNGLFALASAKIFQTGDILSCRFHSGNVVECGFGYREQFVKASKSALACMALIEGAQPPVNPRESTVSQIDQKASSGLSFAKS